MNEISTLTFFTLAWELLTLKVFYHLAVKFSGFDSWNFSLLKKFAPCPSLMHLISFLVLTALAISLIDRKMVLKNALQFVLFHRKSETLQCYFKRPFQGTAVTANHILHNKIWLIYYKFSIYMYVHWNILYRNSNL